MTGLSVPVSDTLSREQDEAKLQVLKKSFRVEYDDMNDVKFYYDKSSPKYSNSNGFYCYVSETKLGVGLRLKVQYYAENWLFIKDFMVKSDSTVLRIFPSSEAKRDNSSGMVWEYWDEPVDKSKLEILQNVVVSKESKIRFNGAQYYSEKPITDSQKKALQRILELFEAMGGNIII